MQDGKVVLEPGVISRVPSESCPGTTHEVRLSKQGTIYCDCEGFRWKGHCRHVDTAVEQTPMLKVLVRASLLAKIEHLREVLKSLDDPQQ